MAGRGPCPSGVDGLAFGHGTIEGGDGLLSWSYRRYRRGFLRKAFGFGEGDLECRDSDLNKSTSMRWRFSATSDRTVDPHHKRD